MDEILRDVMDNKVRLKIVDTTIDHVGPFVQRIADELDIEFVNKDPDFIIHSCFGKDVLKYDGVRICILGENLIPDFNISDYAFATAHLRFGDRYQRLPQYRLYEEYSDLFKVSQYADNKVRDRFCTCVVSNLNRNSFFFKVFDELNKYKTVSSGGRWNNNIGGPVSDKNAFLRTGKFSLVFENSSGSGYVTEKIMQALNAGSIPIYWGAPDIGKDFNLERIINCLEFSSIDALIKRIIEVDNNEQLYQAILKLPVFPDNLELECNQEENIRLKIKNIFTLPRNEAYRRNREFWGNIYQRQLYTSFYKPHIQMMKNLRNLF